MRELIVRLRITFKVMEVFMVRELEVVSLKEIEVFKEREKSYSMRISLVPPNLMVIRVSIMIVMNIIHPSGVKKRMKEVIARRKSCHGLQHTIQILIHSSLYLWHHEVYES